MIHWIRPLLLDHEVQLYLLQTFLNLQLVCHLNQDFPHPQESHLPDLVEGLVLMIVVLEVPVRPLALRKKSEVVNDVHPLPVDAR